MELLNRQALVERLSKDAPVKILLDPQRIAVDSSGHPALGAKDAPVTIVEFADFQCPFCNKTENTLKQLRAKYGDKIRLVHMDFPLAFHSHALDAAKAARCANEQGKFWQFRDALFADQSKLAPADLKATAKTLGLNTSQFDACFDKAQIREPDQQLMCLPARKSAWMERRHFLLTAGRSRGRSRSRGSKRSSTTSWLRGRANKQASAR